MPAVTTRFETNDRPMPPAPLRPPRWPRALALAIVAQPLLIAVNATFHPEVEISGAGILRGAAESPTSWYAIHLVAAIGAVLGAPAALGLRRLVGQRHPRIANLATLTALAGAVMLSMSFMAEASVLRIAASADISDTAALTVADDFAAAPEFYAVPIGALLFAVSGILFGIALLRERRVQPWQAWGFLIGSAATIAATPGSVVGPIAFAVVAVAAVGLATEVAKLG